MEDEKSHPPFLLFSLKFTANQISFGVYVLHVFSVIMALRPSGFVEYSPSEQRIFDQLISEIQNQFQLF